MSKTRVYLDTSLYLAQLLGDNRAQSFKKILKGKILCASVLLLIETERNLVRLSREGKLSEQNYFLALDQVKTDCELFLFKEVTRDLCLNNVYPVVRMPRSQDLVHLRTAHWFQAHGGLEAFLTLDRAQCGAAMEMGLPVV
jgi:hypothetical protein